MNADRGVWSLPQALDRAESDVGAGPRTTSPAPGSGYGRRRSGDRPLPRVSSLSVPECRGHFSPDVEVGWRRHTSTGASGYATGGRPSRLDSGFGALALEEIVSSRSRERRSWAVMERIRDDPGARRRFRSSGPSRGAPPARHSYRPRPGDMDRSWTIPMLSRSAGSIDRARGVSS